MLFPLATSGAMEPFPFLAGTAGALVGGLQNIGSGVLAWLSAMMPQTGQSSRVIDDAHGAADSAVLAAAGFALQPPPAADLSTGVSRIAACALSRVRGKSLRQTL